MYIFFFLTTLDIKAAMLMGEVGVLMFVSAQSFQDSCLTQFSPPRNALPDSGPTVLTQAKTSF